MKHFTPGKYLGMNKTELSVGGILLSETEYEEGFASDWHTHENSYFAFVLNGGCVETRKKESIECESGKLLFYTRQEPHRNHNYRPGSRIFNIELNNTWLEQTGVEPRITNGAPLIQNADLKFLLLKIFKEYRLKDLNAPLTIETMTLGLLASLGKEEVSSPTPAWVPRLKEILNDSWQENRSLKELAKILNVHPVTISRAAPRYLHCTIGEYIRKVRIDKALSLIKTSNENLSDIAYTCGFADQSHFIRSFKSVTGFVPKDYRAC